MPRTASVKRKIEKNSPIVPGDAFGHKADAFDGILSKTLGRFNPAFFFRRRTRQKACV
jgi:hypothetical protein